MKFLLPFFILILPLACSTNDSTKDYDIAASADMEEMIIEENNYNNDTDLGQKLIKESFLRFETQNLDKTYSQIIYFVKQNKGFVQSDNSNKSYNRLSRNLEIRIPSDQFQKTIDSISNHVLYFDTKRISSKDVTEEFIDIEARLKAKKTLENRYLELLSSAKNVKEILEIEKELSNIREEIEAKQGRLKYLQNKVSLSTLSIEFYKQTSESGVTSSYGSKMGNAIKSGFNGLSVFFLGLLHIWPFIIITIIIIFILKRWIKRRHKK